MNIDILSENKNIYLDNDNVNLNITSNKNIVINIYNKNNSNMFLYSNIKNSELILNIYNDGNSVINVLNFNNGSDSDIITSIEFNGENSEINYNSSNIGNIKLDMNITHNYNHTNSNLFISGFNNNNKMKFKIVEKVPELIKDCTIVENSKIINTNEAKSFIEPILLISSNEVTASHSSIIKDIDNDYLEYLCSRGLDSKVAIELIKEGFLFQFFDEDQKKYIKERIYEY